MMTPELIAKLMNPKLRRKQAVKTLPAKKNTGGQFEGKQGTIRRNRKGRTRRLANGERYYVPTLQEWQACGLCLDKKEAS
jgi:hypothetical protein